MPCKVLIKINRCRQLALDDVDTNVDYTSNDAGSNPTYYQLFSFFSYLLLKVIRLLSCILSEDDNLTLGYPF